MPLVSVSSKGQLVIPKKIREALNIKPDQKVLLKMEKDHAELIPVPEDPVSAFCGAFAEGGSLADALLKERKEQKEREEKGVAGLLRPALLLKKRK